MIRFALGSQGKLHKYMKYMVEALKINKNMPDWEREEGRWNRGSRNIYFKGTNEHGQRHLKFYFCCHFITGTNIFLKNCAMFKVTSAPN